MAAANRERVIPSTSLATGNCRPSTISQFDELRLKSLLASLYESLGYALNPVHQWRILRRLSRMLWIIPLRAEGLMLKRNFRGMNWEQFGQWLDRAYPVNADTHYM